MDIFFKLKSKKTKFILSSLSAIFYLLGYSMIMESGNFSVYFISYIHYKENWVDMQYGNLMRPIILLFLSLFSPFSGIMENLFGPRISLLASSIVIEITLFLLFLQRNLWIFYILSLFLGLGSGLSANIVIKNCCYYYPKRKGLINAILINVGALIGSSYTFLGEKIINPSREEVINKKTEPYYRENIAERSKYFFLFGMITIPLVNAISLLLFYKYDPSFEIEDDTKDIKKEKEKENKEDEKIENKIETIKGPLLEGNNEEVTVKENKNLSGEIIEKEEEKKDISNSFNKTSKKAGVTKALKSWRFWKNIYISGLMPFGLYFIFATYRAYASLLGVKGNIVGTLAGAMNIIGSAFNPIWAFFADKYGFQPVMKIISFFVIALEIYFIIFMDNQIFYVIGLYISCIFRGGIVFCVTPHIMHIFGLRYYLTLGGFGKLFNQIFNFLIAMISIFISIQNKYYEDLLGPYRIVCSIGIIIGIIGLILVFYENDKKFDFDEFENEEKKEENDNKKEEDNDKKTIEEDKKQEEDDDKKKIEEDEKQEEENKKHEEDDDKKTIEEEKENKEEIKEEI